MADDGAAAAAAAAAMDSSDQTNSQKARGLQDLAQALHSSLSSLSASSRTLPSERDFHFYRNFDDFKAPVGEITEKSASLLRSIGSSAVASGKDAAFPEDLEDAYDWLVNVNDEVFERFDASADEFRRVRKEEEESGKRIMEVDGGFQLVYGKKKNKGAQGAAGRAATDSVNGRGESSVKVASLKEKVGGPKPKVPFHIPTIRRSQEEFFISVNNANQPFQHVWLQKSEDGQRFIHPLEELSMLDFIDKPVASKEPVKPLSMESTPFKLVEEVRDLKEMAAKLRGVDEFAVDLEHNQYRSFQGLTCLMQVSTRTEDFVVDTLKLRVQIGPHLRAVFKDPSKRKVMHGADRDIIWLQRDFGIYVCNMFDTGQASRVLKLERNSLEYLLHHYCGVTANKEYQNADWRLRPLPPEMIRYAREDTHYLLHIYDVMRNELLALSGNTDDDLVKVYKRSYDLCVQLYEKDLWTDTSYLSIYGLQGAGFNAQQIAVVAGLYEWRDVIARAQDESTGYILPNKTLLEIAKQMPVTTGKLLRLVKSRHPYAERNLVSIVSIIRNSIQNAAAYEAMVELLKERRIALENSLLANDGSQSAPPDTPSGQNDEIVEGTNCVSTICHSVGDRGNQEVISEHPAKDEKVLLNVDRSGDSTAKTLLLCSANVGAAASVQVLKKPGGAFGAFLGKLGPKRKCNTDEKDKKESKLEQIRSSVNLPFHSFSGSEEQPEAPREEPAQESEARNILDLATSKAEDIIMLEDNDNAEESLPDDSDTEKDLDETDSTVPNLKTDKDDEAISLTDLSSSFQRCLESVKQNKKAGRVENSQETSGFLQVKPFDYEAARSDVGFGVDKKDGSGGDEGQKRLLNSRGRKNSSPTDQFQKDDGSRLPQGRRRQAFPASGNRSATFR
ncbi:protein RRP6-like 2 isoform X1 [Syzygium oleosum]|uniref:protein RRP6-like 2 isoform X1 n=1 Tax=Syzygium oleosum TaxID=219896 RepID=UPI0024BA49A7|nr:protein RRP6-like 2 isoform X1 [Syzygium oleosum]